MLIAPAVFFLPGFGLIAMAGPIVAALVGSLEGAVVLGGMSTLGAALTRIGIPKDRIIKYETMLKADEYLLIVNGNTQNVAKTRTVLETSRKLETT